MKSYSILVLPAVALVLFLIGLSIPGVDNPFHLIPVVAGVVVGFIFYIRIFWDVIHTHELNQGERTLWIVIMVCLPMIGQILYAIVHHSVASRQVPKTDI